MRIKSTILVSAIALVLLAGCGPSTTRGEAVALGAAAGGLLGAGMGAAICATSFPFGASACPFVAYALGGAVLGGVVGGIIGKDLPRASDPE